MAKHLEHVGFVRISIDDYIWHRYCQFGVDYAPEQYAQWQAVAEHDNLLGLKDLLKARTPRATDYSVCSVFTISLKRRTTNPIRWSSINMAG